MAVGGRPPRAATPERVDPGTLAAWLGGPAPVTALDDGVPAVVAAGGVGHRRTSPAGMRIR